MKMYEKYQWIGTQEKGGQKLFLKGTECDYSNDTKVTIINMFKN